MKTIAFLLALFSITIGFSQTYLTNGQVYDFNVGDIVQGQHGSSGAIGGPPTYETRTVIEKVFSSTHDTIFYTIKRDFYKLPACATCSPIFSHDTIILTVKDLELPLMHANYTNCLNTKDTLYMGYCNKLVWEMHPVSVDSFCFEPTTHTTMYIKGVGGPFYSKYEPQGPLHSWFSLTYYKKNLDSCGLLSTTIEEDNALVSKVELYPNPAKDIIQVKSAEIFVSYKIVDLTGKVCGVAKLMNNSIDVSDLKTGLYLVYLYTSDYFMVTRKIQKI